jgi:hypothetical protein
MTVFKRTMRGALAEHPPADDDAPEVCIVTLHRLLTGCDEHLEAVGRPARLRREAYLLTRNWRTVNPRKEKPGASSPEGPAYGQCASCSVSR